MWLGDALTTLIEAVFTVVEVLGPSLFLLYGALGICGVILALLYAFTRSSTT